MKFTISILMASLFCSQLSAATIRAEIVFIKRPPFVGLAYIDNGKTTADITSIDQKNKAFSRRLFVNNPGSDLEFLNSDNIDHNIYANSPEDGIKFDVGLLPPEMKVRKIEAADWRDGAIVRIGCKIHPKMKTYVANVTAKNYQIIPFTVKTKDYSFSIGDLDGVQSLVFIIPGYQRIDATLNPGDKQNFDISKKGKVRGSINLRYE